MTSDHRLPLLGSGDISRRRFLALTAASAALGSGAGCRRSNQEAGLVPYTKKAEEIVPGVATYYASATQEGELAYGVLVKTREGRPIHIEGNLEDPIHHGKTGFRVAADLLGLYDPDRQRQPVQDGRPSSWNEVLAGLAGALGRVSKSGREILLVTPAAISPSRRALIAELGARLPGLRHLEWEPHVDHASRRVAGRLFHRTLLPHLRPGEAEVVLSLGADFLGTMGDVTEAARGYRTTKQRHRRGAPASRLYVMEGTSSLTGSNADRRLAVKLSALGPIGFALAKALVARGHSLPPGVPPDLLDAFSLQQVAATHQLDAETLLEVADDLHRAQNRALIVAGSSGGEPAHQAALLLNLMLGTPGVTVDLWPARDLAGPDVLNQAVQRMQAGQVGAAVFWGVNPAYDFADHDPFAAALQPVETKVKIGTLPDETAALCSLVLPENHWLESWGDFDTVDQKALLLSQPVVAPLYDTLQGEDILLRLLVKLGASAPGSYRDYVRRRWQNEVRPQGSPVPFERFWDVCLHDGVFPMNQPGPELPPVLDGAALRPRAEAAATLELALSPDSKLLDGRYANNGWLQELPEAVNKTTWGNPLSISAADADRLGLRDGDVAELAVEGIKLSAPVVVQHGQATGVLGLALGYGRRTGSVAKGVGVDAWRLLRAGDRHGFVKNVSAISRTGRTEPLARTQEHFELGGRDIARLFTLAEFAEQEHERHQHPLPTLYPEEQTTGPLLWGMAIDLDACLGCGACVIACQSENNVSVVGPDQVRKGRSMHWIRIDSYHRGPDGGAVHEPMLCQHCAHAPCENVCPVNATGRSPDGLNQMVYNRCVGTRYCGNNCPYKVRRFNYLEFAGEVRAPLELARNPEVTVRPRGVMEKCTFCVQRIRNGEQVAKNQGRTLVDGEIQPACAVACPTNAIVFGNRRDPSSQVAKQGRDARGFRVLEELGTRPAITYLAALRNPPPGEPKR